MADPSERATDPDWQRYGRALIRAMAEVTPDLPPDLQELVLETADYWLSMGLVIGGQRRVDAERLLRLIEAEEPERAELAADAAEFCSEVLG